MSEQQARNEAGEIVTYHEVPDAVPGEPSARVTIHGLQVLNPNIDPAQGGFERRDQTIGQVALGQAGNFELKLVEEEFTGGGRRFYFMLSTDKHRQTFTLFPTEPIQYTFSTEEEAQASLKAYLDHLGFALVPVKPRGRRPEPLPATLPQPTFAEVKAAVSGLADAPLGRGWSGVEGETAIRHQVAGESIEVKFVSGPLVQWLGVPDRPESLWAKLHELGVPAAMLFYISVGAVLERPGLVITLDELISAIGQGENARRSTAERLRLRRQIWEWLAVFDAWRVIGRRQGKYPDPITRELLDLQTLDELVHVSGVGYPPGTQMSLGASATPSEVTLTAGPWLARFRGNRQVLSDFGEVRRLAAIPAGKPSGAWAQAIGLALQQCWRERASYAEVKHVGEAKRLTVRLGTFTRRKLLDLFPPRPTLDEVLTNANPARGRTYWNDAIKTLKKEKIIGSYHELEELGVGRQGWIEQWLDQPLDIRPDSDGLAAIAEIARSAKVARTARAKRRKPATVGKV
jgi:hypothetical protein